MDDLLLGIVMVALIGTLIILRRQGQRLDQRLAKLDSLQRSLRHAEATLDLYQQRARALGEAAFEALLLIDADRHVQLINQVAQAMFHVELSPDRSLTLLEVTRSHLLDSLMTSALEKKEVLEDQIEIDGRTYRARSLPVDGGVALAIQDVTDLVRLTRARRDMVANISHELRTPISTIRLLIDSLNQKLDRKQAIEAKHIQKISGEIDLIQNMVQELHDLSMIESGRTVMRLTEQALQPLLHDALSRMSVQVEKKKQTATLTTIPAVTVLIDNDQTRRVLSNLIGNAIKFTPSGGALALSADVSGSFVTVRVTDNGPGIPYQERDRVFERFYQVDSARTGHGGSGLGLAIAKHIVEAQGGKIWVEAVDPHGAGLCFTLPLANPTGEADSEHSALNRGEYRSRQQPLARWTSASRDSMR